MLEGIIGLRSPGDGSIGTDKGERGGLCGAEYEYEYEDIRAHRVHTVCTVPVTYKPRGSVC